MKACITNNKVLLNWIQMLNVEHTHTHLHTGGKLKGRIWQETKQTSRVLHQRSWQTPQGWRESSESDWLNKTRLETTWKNHQNHKHMLGRWRNKLVEITSEYFEIMERLWSLDWTICLCGWPLLPLEGDKGRVLNWTSFVHSSWRWLI